MLKEEISATFINSVIKSIQSVCHGCVDFQSNIQVLGHIYLSVDSQTKFDYILNEMVCKNNEESSTMFVSNTFHAEPPQKKGKERTHQAHSSNAFQQWGSRTDSALSAGGDDSAGVDVVVRLGEDHCEVTPVNRSSGASNRRKHQKNTVRKRRLSDSLLSCQYSQSREDEGNLASYERTAGEHLDDVDQKPDVEMQDSSELSRDEAANMSHGEAFSLQQGASDDQLVESAYHSPQHDQRRQRFRSQTPPPHQSSDIAHQFGPSSSQGEGQQSYYAQRLASDSDNSLPLHSPSFPSSSSSTAAAQPSTSRQGNRLAGAERTSRGSEQDPKGSYQVDVDLTLVKDEDSSSTGLSCMQQSGQEFGSAGGDAQQAMGGWEGQQNQDDSFPGRGGNFPPMMRLDASGTAVCYEGGMQPPPDIGGLLDNPHLVPVLPQSHADPNLLAGAADPGQDVMAAVQGEGFSMPRPPPLPRPRNRPASGTGRNLPRAGRIPKEIAEQYGMVELMPGSGVYLHPYQMPNEQRLQGKDGRVCGMRMARHLMSALYSPNELINATLSSNSARHQPLDQVVTEAITNYCFCVMKTGDPRRDVRQAMASLITCKRAKLRKRVLLAAEGQVVQGRDVVSAEGQGSENELADFEMKDNT